VSWHKAGGNRMKTPTLAALAEPGSAARAAGPLAPPTRLRPPRSDDHAHLT
jgi:hypothetical protein